MRQSRLPLATEHTLELSLSQQQIWLDQLSHPHSPHFNIGGIGWVDGVIEITPLSQALEQLVEQSQALRLLPQPNAQQQLCAGWSEPLLQILDFSDKSDPVAAIHNWSKQQFCQPIPLEGNTRPWQITLIKQHDTRHALIGRFHHLVFDGYSVAMAFRHWSSIYNAMVNNQPVVNDRPQYQQFIDESLNYIGSSAYEKDKMYWQQTLDQLPPLILPQQQTTDPAQAQHHYYLIERQQYSRFETFAKSLNATTFHLYIAAVAIYFCRLHQQDQIVIGLPVLNRGGKRYKETLGMFVGMIPFKVSLTGHNTVAELVGDITKNLKRAYRHTRYPLSQLGQDLQALKHAQDRLFDIIISFEIQDFTVHFGEALLNKIQQLFSDSARYPLSLSICEFHDDDPVEVAIESAQSHFSDSQTELFGQRLQHLMYHMCHADFALSELPLLLDAERHEMLYARHHDVPQLRAPEPYIVQFEHQAALRQNAIAVRTLDDCISYYQLNRQANRLARALINQGVESDDIVAVILPRHIETLMAFLAINKACAAFVPIDPDAPLERISKLVSLSNAKAAIIGEHNQDLAQLLEIPCTNIRHEHAPQYDEQLRADNLAQKPSIDNLVYCLYTSGSTGTPKGVLMEHGPLSRRLGWLARTFAFSASDSWLQSIQLTFDPAMLELFLPLCRGATVALAPPAQVPPAELAALAEQLQVSCMIFVPTTLRFFNQVAAHHPDLKLRLAISGGEVLSKSLAQQFVELTGARIYNFYGPTEACIFATVQPYDPAATDDPVPIGHCVDDTLIYILDNNRQVLPQGTVGEIYIGGKGLARGYLNNPEANEKFIDNPFVPGEKLYCSGDNGYIDDNGQICFVGRIDNQIKLRGQRIEPGEVEAALCELKQIKAAAVKPWQDILHAWLVPNDSQSPLDIAKLRKMLQGKLPAHMIPTHFTALAHMPQQSSGKTDYRALTPNPVAFQQDDTPQQNRGNDLEKLLCHLWQELLPNSQGRLDEDFFAAGGDSLKALSLLDKIRAQMGQRLALSMLLQNPTPKKLARALIQKHHPLVVNLSPHQSGIPVYLAASGHGDAVRFSNLAKALGKGYHLFMLHPPELEGYTTYHTMGELAQYYADMIEQRPHNKAPIIAGFSVAGISALETARRLVSQGTPIGGLVMIDTTFPKRLLNRPMLWRACRKLVNSLHIEHLSLNNRTLGSLFNDPGLNGQIYATRGYRPAPLSIPVSLIISSGFNRWYRLLFRPWKKLFGKHLDEQLLNGFHGTLFELEHVEGVAEVIRKLKRA